MTACFAVLFSCEKSDKESETLEVKFDLNYPGATKASSSGFAVGDKVSLYMTEYNGTKPLPLQLYGNVANNSMLTFTGSSWNVSPKVYWEPDKKYDVFAFYPYAVPNSVDDFAFSVQRDQTGLTESGMDAFEASDFLWAKSAGVSYPGPVSLCFEHKMCKLRIKLVKGRDFEGEMPENIDVYIHSTVTDATIDISTGNVTKDNYATFKTIKAKRVSEDVFEAIVVPQRQQNKMPMIEVVSNNVSYLVESVFVYKPGKLQTFNVTLDSDPGKVAIEIGGEIIGWN